MYKHLFQENLLRIMWMLPFARILYIGWCHRSFNNNHEKLFIYMLLSITVTDVTVSTQLENSHNNNHYKLQNFNHFQFFGSQFILSNIIMKSSDPINHRKPFLVLPVSIRAIGQWNPWIPGWTWRWDKWWQIQCSPTFNEEDDNVYIKSWDWNISFQDDYGLAGFKKATSLKYKHPHLKVDNIFWNLKG